MVTLTHSHSLHAVTLAHFKNKYIDTRNCSGCPGCCCAGSTDGSTQIVDCANSFAKSAGNGYMQWGPISNNYNSFTCNVQCKNSVQSCPFILCEYYHNFDPDSLPALQTKGAVNAVENVEKGSSGFRGAEVQQRAG